MKKTIFSIFLMLSISGVANATAILDQDAGGPAGFTFTRCLGCSGSILDIAQTFTVGTSGLLDRVEVDQVYLNLNNGGLTTGSPLLFDIRPVNSSGLPVADDALALASLSISADSLPTSSFQTIVFDLSAFNLSVNSGDLLSFVLRSNDNVFAFATSNNGGVYGAGEYTQRFSPGAEFPEFDAPAFTDGVDMSFRTYVSPVPEPSIFALIGVGLAGLAFTRRRRQQE